jgi:hypothetical protein
MRRIFAGIAQLVEQLICNQQVVGSNPTAGSIVNCLFLRIPARRAWTLLGHFCVSEGLQSRSENEISYVVSGGSHKFFTNVRRN